MLFASGCPRSQVDLALLHRYFRKNNWRITPDIQESDVILISTCGVDSTQEKRSIEKIKKAYESKKQNARFIVTGCLAGVNSKLLENMFEEAILLPPVRLPSVSM